MLDNLIPSVLFCGLATLLLSSCSSPEPDTVSVIETRTVQVNRPAPIVPEVDQIDIRNVEWMVVTPDNVEEVFSNMNNMVIFGLTAQGYEALSLNLADLRISLQQYKEIVAIYKASYEQ